MTDPELPRPLLPDEEACLRALLGGRGFPGRSALLRQVASTRVDGHCPCGCATVDLVVDATAQAAVDAPRLVPIDAEILDADGRGIGGLALFVDEGRLSSLEVYSYDGPISALPPVSRIRFGSG